MSGFPVLISGVITVCVFRYFEELCEQKRRAGKALLTWNDLQTGLNTVNTAAHEEHERQSIRNVLGAALVIIISLQH